MVGRAFVVNPVDRDGHQVLHSFVLDAGTDVLEDRLIWNLNLVNLLGHGLSLDGSDVALLGHGLISSYFFHSFGANEF